MKTSKKTFRRDFLKKSLLTAAGVSVVPGLVLAKGVGLKTESVTKSLLPAELIAGFQNYREILL